MIWKEHHAVKLTIFLLSSRVFSRICPNVNFHVFFFLVTFRIGSKFSWPGCPWPKNISAQFSANKLSGASQNRRRKTSFGRKMSTAMVFNTPGLPVYEVFPGVGMTPTILVTSEPLSDLIQWQFLGKAPAHMPMHQVVHSLQQRLAEKPNWTPQMVSRWHRFFSGIEKESCNLSKNMNEGTNWISIDSTVAYQLLLVDALLMLAHVDFSTSFQVIRWV